MTKIAAVLFIDILKKTQIVTFCLLSRMKLCIFLGFKNTFVYDLNIQNKHGSLTS